MVFQTLCGELLTVLSRVHTASLSLSNPRQLAFSGSCWSSGRWPLLALYRLPGLRIFLVFQTLCGELLAAFSGVHTASLPLSNPRQLAFSG